MTRQICNDCGKTMRIRKKTKDWTHKSPQDWMGCPGPNGMGSFMRNNQGALMAAAGAALGKKKRA